MAGQKRSGDLRFQRLGCALPAGKIDIPVRADHAGCALLKPVTLSGGKPEVEDADRDIAVQRPHRRHRILQQREIAAIGSAGDNQPGCGCAGHGSRRYPPGSVTRISACAGSRSIFCRKRYTCVSRVCVVTPAL